MKIIINKQGQVFAGCKNGLPYFSNDWAKAKPLHEHSTKLLKQYNKELEIIDEKEF